MTLLRILFNYFIDNVREKKYFKMSFFCVPFLWNCILNFFNISGKCYIGIQQIDELSSPPESEKSRVHFIIIFIYYKYCHIEKSNHTFPSYHISFLNLKPSP